MTRRVQAPKESAVDSQNRQRNSVTHPPHLAPKCVCVVYSSRSAAMKKVFVFFERRAAPGGVGDDCVEIFAKENVEVLASEIACSITDTGMRRERATAGLPGGHDHFAAICSEHANRGFV